MVPETNYDALTQLKESLKSSVDFCDYQDVKVLALYWEEAETDGFKTEGAAVCRLFQDLFHYPTREFAIPSKDSLFNLTRFMFQEIPQKENRSLCIIHYGGHGDRDDDKHSGQERRSVWAALNSGGPVLEWYKIQDFLRESGTDILLILDCCYAGQSSRDRDTGRSGFEILAAAAMGMTTPPPGDKSFTMIFLKEVRETMAREGMVKIKDLHGRLSNRQKGLFAQPVHTTLKEGRPSIVLKPLSVTGTKDTQQKESQFVLELLVHLEEELNSKHAYQIGQWLQTNLPHTVSGLDVIDRTKKIQKAVQDVEKNQKPYLECVNLVSKEQIIDAWKGVVELLRKYGEKKNGRRIGELVKQLDVQNTTIFDLFEQSILTSPEMDKSDEALENAIEDNEIKALGISSQLRMKRIVRANYPSGQTQTNPPRGNEVSHQVMDEYKVYGEYIAPAQMPSLKRRVELLYQLLNTPKDESFCALRCIEWSHQEEYKRFTFTFEIPSEFKTPSIPQASSMLDGRKYVTLEQILVNEKGRDRPTMNQRLRVAFLLAKAIYKWHRVGWLHQGIGSPNVIFFGTEDKNIDYSRPFLHGFDFSRPDIDPSLGVADKNDGLDIYRHPDRKGDSQKGFTKEHDYYSLGVVMLEIGLWESFSNSKSLKGLDAEKVRTKLQRHCADRLAHYAGETYQAAVGVCLKGNFGVEFDDKFGNNLLREFQTKVVDEIKKGVCL
ncbi:hypothetical protein F5B19DRAFT_472144 [Rostrohypoxylon terebratum]|nr:hypothetical protein F5B19DRAFT_472144 [Rostrohypoxylon terebratum]